MNIDDAKRFEPIDGKWYITKELGKGAFGTVFEIERKDFKSMKSALKIISIPASSAEYHSFISENYDLDNKSITSYFYGFVEEVVKECQVMAQLRGSSNIVSYEDHDVIERKDSFGWDIFIRMELLKTVTSHFDANKPTTNDIVKLGIDICKALETCNKFSIIHRDIKPSNIFVSKIGNYKLGDFGVARTLEKTSNGLSKKGTYTYMAPEVYKGEEYGPNVDIYSLGILMYRLLNNNMEPFRRDRTYSDGEMALARRIKGETIPDVSGISKSLSDIILKACAFKPYDRWQTPEEMRAALEAEYTVEGVTEVRSGPTIRGDMNTIVKKSTFYNDKTDYIIPAGTFFGDISDAGKSSEITRMHSEEKKQSAAGFHKPTLQDIVGVDESGKIGTEKSTGSTIKFSKIKKT